MHTNFEQFSDKGQELAYSIIAFNAGQRMVNGLMSAIAAEEKAKAEPHSSVDGEVGVLTDMRGNKQEQDNDDESRVDNGYSNAFTVEQACSLFNAANDELLTLANGGRWPRAQSLDGIFTALKRNRPMEVTEDQRKGMVALLKASTGQDVDSTDPAVIEMINTLSAAENASKATFFAERIKKHEELLRIRAEEMIDDWNKNFRSTFAEEFDNLPVEIKLRLLRSFDSRINTECRKLLTGQNADGSPSGVASIPPLARAAEIMVLRADQKLTKVELKKLGHAEPAEVKANREPATAAA